MAKTISSYKGLWKTEKKEAQDSVPALAAETAAVASVKAMHRDTAHRGTKVHGTPSASEASAHESSPGPVFTETQTGPAHAGPQETADQLAHRYRMLVLREHRYKLGRDLLELGNRDPWILAFESVKTLGRSFRPWAHARIFALGCYLGVDMSPEVLKQLRHPLRLGRYQRSMFGLWRLLEILAQKTGQKPVPRFFFRLFYLCPPLGVFIYERRLQSVLRQALGSNAGVAPVMTNATQGQ